MGEANRWQDAFRTALREQAILIAGLMQQIKRLEEKINEDTKQPASGQEIIQGVTGAQYAALEYPRPSGVRQVEYPVGEEKFGFDKAVRGE